MKSWNKVVTLGLFAGIAAGFLCTGCGKEGATRANDSTGEATVPAQTTGPIKWSHKGVAFTAVRTMATKRNFSNKPGVMLTFCDDAAAPAKSVLRKNSVEVFFPAQGSGYGKPISVAFHKGSETVQESSASGYNGRLTANGSKLSGELNINGIGYDEDCSITGSFEVTLAGQ